MVESKRTNNKPSEKAAFFVLGIINWVRYIFCSPRMDIPRGHAVQHQGNKLPPQKFLRYPTVLLVEDDANIAGDFIEAIKGFYLYGSVTIFVAHAYDAAVTFFENENISLVIMDADLNDMDGDGAMLVQEFLSRKPQLDILANSSSRISNLKLTGLGAKESLEKKTEKLRNWLLLHDPAGGKFS